MCAPPLAWHKQRFGVVFCVWRALRWARARAPPRFSGPNCRVQLFNYRVRGPRPRLRGPLHARAKMRVHNIRIRPEHVDTASPAAKSTHKSSETVRFATRKDLPIGASRPRRSRARFAQFRSASRFRFEISGHLVCVQIASPHRARLYLEKVDFGPLDPLKTPG